MAHASLLLPHQETQRLLTTAVPAEHKKFCKALTKFSMLAVNHPQNFNSGNMEKGRKRCFWGQASIILPKENPGSYFKGGKCLAPRQDMGFPGGSAGTESSCDAGDLGSIPGLRRSPGEGKGYPLQYSGLENSTDCIVHGVAKSWTQPRDFHFTGKDTFIICGITDLQCGPVHRLVCGITIFHYIYAFLGQWFSC